MNTVLTRFVRIFTVAGVISCGSMMPHEPVGQDGWRKFLVPTLAAGVTAVITASTLKASYDKRKVLQRALGESEQAKDMFAGHMQEVEQTVPLNIRNNLANLLDLSDSTKKMRDQLKARANNLKNDAPIFKEYYRANPQSNGWGAFTSWCTEMGKRLNEDSLNYFLGSPMAERNYKTVPMGADGLLLEQAQMLMEESKSADNKWNGLRDYKDKCYGTKNGNIKPLEMAIVDINLTLNKQRYSACYNRPWSLVATTTAFAGGSFGLAWLFQRMVHNNR